MYVIPRRKACAPAVAAAAGKAHCFEVIWRERKGAEDDDVSESNAKADAMAAIILPVQ